MKNKIEFAKMVASGNDFVVIEKTPKSQTPGPKPGINNFKSLARGMCDRKYGIGADGLLVLEKAGNSGVKMRIFNADGSEAEMCGNGARCTALYSASSRLVSSPEFNIATKAGMVRAIVKKNSVKIRLTEPRHLRLDIPIMVNGRRLRVDFVNTGVPHTVIFVEGLDKIGVFNLGREIRHHDKFKPSGTNVDFVEVLNGNSIRVRTYERGVEDETLACGTGSVASAIVASDRLSLGERGSVNVHTKGGEVLKVYYKKEGNKFKDVWLEGKASIVYKGVYHV